LLDSVRELTDWINKKRGPFSVEFINIWYKRYLNIAERNTR
jgi:protein associated with RNAse G/E